MRSDETRFEKHDYLQLLDLLIEVIDALAGQRTNIYKMESCNNLAIKIYFHCSTIYYLKNGTKVNLPTLVDELFQIDFSSIMILTRTIFENFLKMCEVFFYPKDLDERKFQFALWELSGFVLRERIEIVAKAHLSKLEEHKRDIRRIRIDLINTNAFCKLSRGKRRRALRNGKFPGTWREIARKSGFKSEKFLHMYALQSSHVHGDALSGAQVRDARTIQDQEELTTGNLWFAMVVMAKMIVLYARTFPASDLACRVRPEQFKLAVLWAGIAEKMP